MKKAYKLKRSEKKSYRGMTRMTQQGTSRQCMAQRRCHAICTIERGSP